MENHLDITNNMVYHLLKMENHQKRERYEEQQKKLKLLVTKFCMNPADS